jgi:hypothetical protein
MRCPIANEIVPIFQQREGAAPPCRIADRGAIEGSIEARSDSRKMNGAHAQRTKKAALLEGMAASLAETPVLAVIAVMCR